jgi:hypothetical protein
MQSVNREFGCSVFNALEERIWLDRRELACLRVQIRPGVLGRVGAWLRVARTRMQLGPVQTAGWGGGWTGGDPDKPF